MPEATPEQITAFIGRWESSGAAERANYALFLTELCTLLDLASPEPTEPDNSHNTYVFERAVTRKNPDGTTSTGFIDLYRRGSFVLESKQGTNAPDETEPAHSTPPPMARPAMASAASSAGYGPITKLPAQPRPNKPRSALAMTKPPRTPLPQSSSIGPPNCPRKRSPSANFCQPTAKTRKPLQPVSGARTRNGWNKSQPSSKPSRRWGILIDRLLNSE